MGFFLYGTQCYVVGIVRPDELMYMSLTDISVMGMRGWSIYNELVILKLENGL